MADHTSLKRCLKLIVKLAGNEYGLTVKQLATRLNTTERTVYRYLNTLEELGFETEKKGNGRYALGGRKTDLLNEAFGMQFSVSEAELMSRLVSSITKNSALKKSISAKLGFWINPTDQAALQLLNMQIARNTEELLHAQTAKQKVVLHNYRSAHSNTIKNRLVEPFHLRPSAGIVYAYDTATGGCKAFKIARIEKVEPLTERFEHESKHKLPQADAFGMAGDKKTDVKLHLTLRGYNLLTEEFPDTIENITARNNDEVFKYQYTSTLNGTKGIGRFITGLPGDVKIIKPASLKTEIVNNAKKLVENFD